MSRLKIIQMLLLAENILCIYRNFPVIGTRYKFFVVAWLTTETIVHGIGFLQAISSFFFQFPKTVNMLSVMFFGIFANFNAFLVVILAFKNTACFTNFCSHIDAVYNELISYTIFQKSLFKANLQSIILSAAFTSAYSSIVLIFTLEYISNINSASNMYSSNPGTFAFGIFTIFFAEFRFFIEFLTFIILITIISGSLNCLQTVISESVTITQKSYHLKNCNCFRELVQNLKKWDSIINNLSVCNKQLQNCFGVQILYSLFAAVVYFIFLMYRGVNLIMTQEERDLVGSKNTIFLLVNYSVLTVSMLHAGQKARNEADEVTRALARLNNSLVTIAGEDAVELRKLVKDLHRQMVAEPIQIKLLSTVPVQMQLLPDILATVITYTIILLQFNHVV